jgi:hypothetical protein
VGPANRKQPATKVRQFNYSLADENVGPLGLGLITRNLTAVLRPWLLSDAPSARTNLAGGVKYVIAEKKRLQSFD